MNFVRHCVTRAAAAAVILLAVPALAGSPIAATWTGGGANDNWNTTDNWDILTVPCNGANTYDVLIDGDVDAFSATLNLSCGVDNLTIGANDALSMNNNLSLSIVDGGLSLDGTLSMNSAGNPTDLVLADGSAWAGNGVVELTNQLNNRIYGVTAASAVTIPASTTLTFRTGAARIGSSSPFLVLHNEGAIELDGTTDVRFCVSSPQSTNSGTIQAINGGAGTLDCGTFDNTGGTIVAAEGSSIEFEGGGVIGGELATTGTGIFRIPNLNNGTLGGAITLNGAISLESAGNSTDLIIQDGTSLGGVGVINATSNLNNRIYGVAATDSLTVEPGATLSFRFGQVGVGSNSSFLVLHNQGMIEFDETLDIRLCLNGTEQSTNTGTMRAINGGLATLDCNLIDNTGGTILADEASIIDFEGGGVIGGELATTGTGTFRIPNLNNGALGGAITLNGAISLESAGNSTDLIIQDGTSLGGVGAINATSNLNNRIYGVAATDSLTVEPGATLSFRSGQLRVGSNSSFLVLHNQGTIEFDETLDIRLCLNGNVMSTNSGTIRAVNGGVAALDCNFIDNAGGTILADEASVIDFEGGGVIGGELATTGTGTFRIPNFNSGTLGGAIALNGAISLESAGNGTDLIIQNGTSLSGLGSIEATSNLNNRIYGVAATDSLTVEPGATLSFRSGQLRVGSNSSFLVLHNQGMIEFDETLDIRLCLNGSVMSTNSGTIRAVNGGVAALDCNFIDNTGGTILADEASVIDFEGGGVIGGELATSGTGMFRIPNNNSGTLGEDITVNGTLSFESLGSGTDIIIQDGTTLHGDATFLATSSLNNRIYGVSAASRLTLADGASVTVAPNLDLGASGSINIGTFQMNLTIDGTLTGDGNVDVELRALDTEINGLVRAVNGSFINFDNGSFEGSGSIEVDDARVLLSATGPVQLTGDVTVANAGELEVAANSDVVVHNLTADETGILDVDGNAVVTLSGNFSYAMLDGAGWEWINTATLALTGGAADPCDTGSFVTIEAGGPDFQIPNLRIKPGARVRIVDAFDNDTETGPEALHVDDLFIEGDGVLHLDGLTLVANSIDGDFDCQVVDGDFIVAASNPPQGAIDARQPSNVDGSNPAGWDSIEITFCGDVSGAIAEDFAISELGGDGTPPGIASIDILSSDTVRVNFDGFIETKAWTAVSHISSGSCVRVGYLPADVSADGIATAVDVLRAIDCLNGQAFCEPFSLDVDRSGLASGPDVLRTIDLLNGAGVYDVFNGVSLPTLP